VAYALAEGDDSKRAAKYYELFLKKRGTDTAALNNLAIIREKCGDLQQAEQLLSKAKSLNPDDALVKRNLERIISLRKSGVEFMAMPYKNKNALLRLWETRDIEDKITIDSDELPSLLGLSDDEAASVFRLLIKNKVILPCPAKENIGKIKKYILNPAVRCNIAEIEKEVEERTPIMEIINNIANDGLSRSGFNKEIIDTLKKVFSSELRNYLKRDLQEAAFSLLTRSYKTTQVMCGSVIEAVLLDKLSKQGKMKYLCEDKKLRNINKMNLDQLLFVSLQEKLINEQLYHLAHGLRGYRNLIHPGVEQRGQAVSISESNAKLAWDITRKLLKEI
jgi:tetratricopeptide (TPR) repeat protein